MELYYLLFMYFWTVEVNFVSLLIESNELLKGKVREALWCMLFADDKVIIGEKVEEVNEMLSIIRGPREQRL